jgi:conjugative transfer region protein TrbK
MRGSIFNLRAIGRAAFFVGVAAAVIVAAAHFRNSGCAMVERVRSSTAAQLARDPLSFTLEQCQAVGMAAKDSPLCEAVWAENRRRFFTGHLAPPIANLLGHTAPLLSGTEP